MKLISSPAFIRASKKLTRANPALDEDIELALSLLGLDVFHPKLVSSQASTVGFVHTVPSGSSCSVVKKKPYHRTERTGKNKKITYRYQLFLP